MSYTKEQYQLARRNLKRLTRLIIGLDKYRLKEDETVAICFEAVAALEKLEKSGADLSTLDQELLATFQRIAELRDVSVESIEHTYHTEIVDQS